MRTSTVIAIASALSVASARNSTPFRRATFPIPASQGTVTLTETQIVDGVFDGGFKTYGRGVSCTGQAEGGDSDAVFELADGATLSNVIIGEDQIEGVHCMGSCTIENVWWAKVCEDALTFKGDGDATVTGGGAIGADDKVIQHNGAGSVTIDGFTVQDFGKLYRSCGNCDQNGAAREVIIKGVTATNGDELVGINANYGDTATFSNVCATGVKDICSEWEGTNDNDVEPAETSTGPSAACIYTDADVAC